MQSKAPLRPLRFRTRFRSSRGDYIAIGIILAIPILLYVPLSVVGHPFLPGDDLNQNYPLRVLSGAIIRAGHLPSWDPFIWSGTPLLAGWNAGALYPGTWLFALFPGIAAWTVNLVLVNAICGIGTYILLRLFRCGPIGAVLGALCFTYTGFMSGQLNHIGMVQGTGFVPWMLIAVELLVRSLTLRTAVWPMALLAAATSMCILAGEPRAISSSIIIVTIYFLARALALGFQRGIRLFASVTIGTAIGTGIAAIQWLPGLIFLARSQRTLDAYQAFGTGSLSLLTIARSALTPFILGSNGIFNTPHYVGGYNLQELTIGVGLLPLVAATAYLPQLLAHVQRKLGFVLRHKRTSRIPIKTLEPDSTRALGIWYFIGLVGLVLTLGTTTPIGRVLVKIPLYGGERLQNRNAVIIDFSLAILLGFFVDDLIAFHKEPDKPFQRKSNPLGTPARRVFAVLPVICCVGLIALAYTHPIGMQVRFGVAHPSERLFINLTPYLGPTFALAVAIGLLVFLAHRMARVAFIVIIVLLASLETSTYIANSSWLTSPSSTLAGPTILSPQFSKLTDAGRYAIYNPLVSGVQGTAELEETDLNILPGLMSIQGYGSIVSGSYQNATNTHNLESLNPAVLNNGLGNVLDLRVLLTLPIYLDEPIPSHSAIPVAGAPPATSSGLPGPTSDAPSPAPLASGPWKVGPQTKRTWFLPTVASLIRVTVVLNSRSGTLPASVNIGLGEPRGTSKFASTAVVNGQAHLVLPAPIAGESVVVRNSSQIPITVGAVVVVTKAPGERLLLDGSLQGSLSSPQWTYAGQLGALTMFTNHDAAGLAWLQPLSTKAPPAALHAPGSVTTTVTSSGVETMVANTETPAILVRSVAFQQGWTADLTPLGGGPVRAEPVTSLGLVQAIHLPAGRYRVTWLYASRGLVAGGALSLVSLVIFVMLIALAVVDRRKRSGSELPRRMFGRSNHPVGQ